MSREGKRAVEAAADSVEAPEAKRVKLDVEGDSMDEDTIDVPETEVVTESPEVLVQEGSSRSLSVRNLVKRNIFFLLRFYR